MTRIIAMTVSILSAVIFLSACSLFQEKTEQKTGQDTNASLDTARLLPGTWKIISVNCDATGSNCNQYAASRVFSFSDNGEFTVNGRKRGRYRLEDKNCILVTENKQYTVTIVQIGTSRMVTGEPYRDTTEVLNRTK
ncbi:MAG TPA: hypothetical protein PLA65_08515 [Spirochaetota bacterium]|nr:hypothetical protein [Spirochaetota bacterium]HPN12090.1 hypothetical protein [Spirochaetota bacterium]